MLKPYLHKVRLASGVIASPKETPTKSGAVYRTAVYKNPAGVALLTAYQTDRSPYSIIEFVYDGIAYNWSFDRAYTLKGLARIANRLISETLANIEK